MQAIFSDKDLLGRDLRSRPSSIFSGKRKACWGNFQLALLRLLPHRCQPPETPCADSPQRGIVTERSQMCLTDSYFLHLVAGISGLATNLEDGSLSLPMMSESPGLLSVTISRMC